MNSQRIPINNKRLNNSRTMYSHQQNFVYSSLLGCLQFQIYIVLKNANIYVYRSLDAYMKSPSKPLKFFNLNNVIIQLKDGWMSIKDQFFQQRLTSSNLDKIEQLFEKIQFNKQNITINKIFPKKFQQLECRLQEKIQLQK